MKDDIDDKAVSLTAFIFKVPAYKRLLLYLIIGSFLAGIAKHLAENYGRPFAFSDAFVLGGSDGAIFFGIPALVSAFLAVSLLSRSAFKQTLKYFLFISLISMALYAVFYCAAIMVEKTGLLGVTLSQKDFLVVLANALVLIVWFVALLVPLDYNAAKALLVSLFQPVLNLAFFVIAGQFAATDAVWGASVLLAIKFAIASAILLFALWSVFIIINAPAKRNFGISAVQTAAMFFAQWIKGGKGLEEVLSEVGTEVETTVSAVVFKAKGKIKALFLVPYVHFGPLGNLGGSEFPYLLSQSLGRKYKTNAFVFHATANHDFNPVFSSSHAHVHEKFAEAIDKARDFAPTASFATASFGSATIFGLSFGKKDAAFLALSRHPQSTEDIDPSLGIAISAKVQSKGFQKAAVVDMHNSKTSGHLIETGSREFYDYFDALDKITLSKNAPLSMGTSQKQLPFTQEQGVGKAGLKVAVFKCGGKTACILLIDANNALPTFRSHVVDAVKEYGFDFVDVMTTDTHSVNSIGGVHNPLGTHVKPHDLLPHIRECIDSAMKGVEPVQAAMQSERIRMRVLGEKRSSELLSTVNAIVSVIKILAPIIFVFSLLLSAAILLLVSKYFSA